MKKHSKSGKYVAPTICAVLGILLPAFYLGLFIWCSMIEPIPLPLLAVLVLGPGAVIVGVIIALLQRYQEIKGGEEDDASQY